MNTSIINLALPAVKQAIAKILETYPDHPHQQAFANPELRQRLIAYVLSQTDCKYTTSRDGQSPQIDPETLFPSPEQQSHLEDSIHQGVHRLLQDKVNWVNHHIPQEEKPGKEPSHWFG
jgi:predicted Co/Zn/Cd cation transporter (cation efflux family)